MVDDLSASSLPSFAGGIAGLTSGPPLGFQGGFPCCLLSEVRITALLLGLQRGLTSGSLGSLRSGSLTSLSGQLGGSSLGDTGIASRPDRLPCHPPLDGGLALGLRPRSGCPLQLGFPRLCGCAQAVSKTGFLGPVHLNLWERLLAQRVDGFRSALATPYSRAWTTRPRLKSSRACRDGSLRSSSVRLSDGVTRSVEGCRLRSAEFLVALLQSQNRTTERWLSRANYVAGCVSKI